MASPNDERPLILGVPPRGLARTQAEDLANALGRRRARHPIHLEIVGQDAAATETLHDDHIAENRSEIRRLHRLLREEAIDVVIHRGFDLRGDVPDDLRIAAVLTRGKPYEVLVSPHGATLDLMDEDERLGVVHLRTRAQILDYRPELETEIIPGDAGDWLSAMIDGRVDALVAPGAAIEQLGLQAQVSEIFPVEMVVPGPGSGVLVCLVRRDDEESAQRLRGLHDPTTAAEYTAECSTLEALGGPWERPFGVLARQEDDRLTIHAVAAAPDGSEILRETWVGSADDPCRAGAEAAALLLERGADHVIEGPAFSDDDPEADDWCDTIAGLIAPADAEWEAEDDSEID